MLLDLPKTPKDILQRAQDVITRKETLFDILASLPPEKCNFSSIILPFALVENDSAMTEQLCTFLQHVSPDKAMREASSEADKMFRQYYIESRMKEDLYEVVKHAKENTDLDSLDKEDKRLLEKICLEFKRSGLELDPETRKEVLIKRKRINELCILYSQRLNEDTTFISVTKDELKGMPDDWLSGLKVDESGLYKVTVKYPDLFPGISCS